MTREQAYANDAVWARFYRDGKNLGEIAEEFGGSIYTYSPWLAAPLVRSALSQEGKEAAPPPAEVSAGVVFTATRGDARSHLFEDRLFAGEECIAFVADDWTDRILATLSPSAEKGEVERLIDGLVAIAAEAHTRHFNPGLFEHSPPRFEDADDCFVALLSEAKKLRAALTTKDSGNV